MDVACCVWSCALVVSWTADKASTVRRTELQPSGDVDIYLFLRFCSKSPNIWIDIGSR